MLPDPKVSSFVHTARLSQVSELLKWNYFSRSKIFFFLQVAWWFFRKTQQSISLTIKRIFDPTIIFVKTAEVDAIYFITSVNCRRAWVGGWNLFLRSHGCLESIASTTTKLFVKAFFTKFVFKKILASQSFIFTEGCTCVVYVIYRPAFLVVFKIKITCYSQGRIYNGQGHTKNYNELIFIFEWK